MPENAELELEKSGRNRDNSRCHRAMSMPGAEQYAASIEFTPVLESKALPWGLSEASH